MPPPAAGRAGPAPTENQQLGRSRPRQTARNQIQVLVLARAWRFKSSHPHHKINDIQALGLRQERALTNNRGGGSTPKRDFPDWLDELTPWIIGRMAARREDEKRTELTVARDRVRILKNRLGLKAISEASG